MQASRLSLTGSWGEPAKKYSQPQPLGTAPSRLQELLARNRADRRQPFSPHPTLLPTRRVLSPAHPNCPAKDRLIRWPPLLSIEASLSSEDLEKCYQLAALAWEPSTLSLYEPGLLVFHAWGNSRSLPEDQWASVPQETIERFITDLAGAYAGDTIANYTSCMSKPCLSVPERPHQKRVNYPNSYHPLSGT